MSQNKKLQDYSLKKSIGPDPLQNTSRSLKIYLIVKLMLRNDTKHKQLPCLTAVNEKRQPEIIPNISSDIYQSTVPHLTQSLYLFLKCDVIWLVFV